MSVGDPEIANWSKKEAGSIFSRCDILIDCLECYISGSQDERGRAQSVLIDCAHFWFSANLVSSNAAADGNGVGGGPPQADHSRSGSGAGRAIVKKRPSTAAVGSRRLVLQFFETLEICLGLVVTSANGSTLIQDESDGKCSSRASRCRELWTRCGDRKTLEATFWLVGVLGSQISHLFEMSISHPHAVYCTVVVDTYETYLCRAILMGSRVMGVSLPDAERKHLALLPWWLYLSSLSGIFPLKEEEGWSHRMTRNVLFSISDSLVRQTISSSEQSRESLLGYSQGLRASPADGAKTGLGKGNVSFQTPLNNAWSYREGLSANVGAEAIVNNFLMEMGGAGYPAEGLSPSSSMVSPPFQQQDAGPAKSPSPRRSGLSAYRSRSPRYISPSASQFAEGKMRTTEALINPKTKRKVTLQFAAKLGNLYATQDVHAMLSFLPQKKNAPIRHADGNSSSPCEQEWSPVVHNEEKEESNRSWSDGSTDLLLRKGKENTSSFESVTVECGEVPLRDKLFEFLEIYSSFQLPLSASHSQQLALFIALCLLTRNASHCPPNFGRVPTERLRQRQVAFGVQFGYEQLVWPIVVTTFLDTCTVGAICAATEEHQAPLAKQLSATIASFMRHCYAVDFKHPSGKKMKLHFMARRWVPKCRFLVHAALEPRNNANERSAKHQLLRHLHFLTYYYQSVLDENTTIKEKLYEKETADEDGMKGGDFFVSPQRVRGGTEEDGRMSFLKDVLVEGEEIVHALHHCMNLLPWGMFVTNEERQKEEENQRQERETGPLTEPSEGDPLCARTLFNTGKDQTIYEGSEHSDVEFVKYCIHYYLTVLDALIEIALFSSTHPRYLTAILLARSDMSDPYLVAPGSEVMDSCVGSISRQEKIDWQRVLNYHCQSIMKFGPDHVDIQFITTLRQWQKKFPSFPMWLHPFDSLHLDYLDDFTPSPEQRFKDSWYFLRLLNHAKRVTKYVCAKANNSNNNNSYFLVTARGDDAKDSLRKDVVRYVNGVTPYLSPSSGTFTQSLSVPHQHPFTCLEQEYRNGQADEGIVKQSLEAVCRDLWLRTQALQLLSAASAPISVTVDAHEDGDQFFILNGSSSKTYVRLLFLRIVQSVFSQHGSYDEQLERSLIHNISVECKHLYGLAKQLWTSCLTLTLQTIQSMSHHHTKARETAMQLGVHAVLSRLLDALSAHQRRNTTFSITLPSQASASSPGEHHPPTTVDMLEDTIMLDDSVPPLQTSPMKSAEEQSIDQPPHEGEGDRDGDQNDNGHNDEQEPSRGSGPTNTAAPSSPSAATPFSFHIPQLSLDGVGPALYFLSSGDTGAALQATLFPGMPVGAPLPNDAVNSALLSTTPETVPPEPAELPQQTNEPEAEPEPESAQQTEPTSPTVVPHLEFSSIHKMNTSPTVGKESPSNKMMGPEGGIINPQHLYADAYLLSCAVCCTCSLLVQHSGMLRYESTVSIGLLRKRLHLPEASYHLLYGGDLTWKKHVEDTRNSAVLKSFLGWYCADQRSIRPSFVFRSLRECISSAAGSSFLSVLEKWLDQHSLTHYRNALVTGAAKRRENRWRHIEAIMKYTDDGAVNNKTYTPANANDVNDDASRHSTGLFVLLRLLIPRAGWNQQFDFHHRLGAGGFGTVMSADFNPSSSVSGTPASRSSHVLSKWCVEEKKTFESNPAVAIKMMPLLQQHDVDSGMLPMCHAEVLAMMCLRGHPHIAPLLSFGSSEDGYFIALPRYDAGSLHDWRLRQYPPGCAALVHSHSPLKSASTKRTSQTTPDVDGDVPSSGAKETTLLELCCPLITQLLEAVVFMHSQQIRHNDIKAENLLIDTIDISSHEQSTPNENAGTDSDSMVFPQSIRLCDFGSCDTCTDEDMQELLRDLVAGESRFMEGRWGFGNGTEAIQPPEIIVPRWRYELMRTMTLHFVATHHVRHTTPKQPLTTSFALVRKHNDEEEASDIDKLLGILRQIELSADIWSCGCLLYEVLTGGMLFGEGKLGRLTALATAAREQLAERTRVDQLKDWSEFRGAVTTSPALDQWDIDDLTDAVGIEVVDFLQELLNIDPLQRPTAVQALEKWKSVVKKVI